MKTKSLFVAAVAIMMAACSETDNISVQNTAQQAETAVSFDTYTAKALTRAGAPGEIITKEDLQVNNFGVFAYYTQNADNAKHYPTDAANTKLKPDFMWNQKVEYDGDNWFYFPVKYWPNETNATGDGNYVDSADPTNNHATTPVSSAPDKVTFFAYAPFVDASTSGAVTPNSDGITGILTLNDTKADPRLGYRTPTDPLKTVDLLWGVVPSYKTKYTTVLGEQGGLTAGRPNYNLVKQKAEERIMFQFKHALAKLTLDVVGFFDDVPEHGAHSTTDPGNPGDASDQSANNVAKDTKIVIEYVKLSTEKYAMSDVLNLNNQTANSPEWEAITFADANKVNFTISGNQLTNLIRYRTPSDVTKGYAEQPRGVTKDAIALLANDASQEAFFGIIPKVVNDKTDAKWTAEIKYHVFTKDANLENGYSEITNVIKKEDIDMAFDAGKHYTLRLRLGMTTVKFDATVEDWIDGGTTPADLPINVAVKSVDNGTFTATAKVNETTHIGYANKEGSFSGTTTTALALENTSYTLAIKAESVKATLENATGDGASKTVSAEATTINTDVDWIKPVYNSTTEKWELVITENRTSENRSGNIWATYGGVNSVKVPVTQYGSNLVLTLKWEAGNTLNASAWNGRDAFNYKIEAQYQDKGTSGHYIDVAKEANVAQNFNINANWVTIAPTADAKTGTLSVTSNNEDESSKRTATINFSYDGKTSESIWIDQNPKPVVTTP